MITAAQLVRGTVFRAEHDDSFGLWLSDEPRSKFCIVFNAAPPGEDGDVHYFMATKNVARFTENPLLLPECVILPKGSYSFLEFETAIDLMVLWIVPLAKLQTKRMRIVGTLTPDDIAKCEGVIRRSRVLAPKDRKLLML